MADLVLLNGPPASGKSTLAAELATTRPLALVLDIDVVRSLLGMWEGDASRAGLAARRIAAAMATAHLIAGHDVIVPQFLARVDFIVELETIAIDVGARFVEVALMLSRADALAAFAERSAASTTQQHREAAADVERDGGEPALAAMYDRWTDLMAERHAARCVGVVRGDITATLRSLEEALLP